MEEVVGAVLLQLLPGLQLLPKGPHLCLLNRAVPQALLPTLLQLPSSLVSKVKVQDFLDRWLLPQRRSIFSSPHVPKGQDHCHKATRY